MLFLRTSVRHSALLVLGTIATLLLGPRVPAQGSEKAVKQLKQAMTSLANDASTRITDARETLVAALAETEDTVKAGGFDVAVAEGLFDATASFADELAQVTYDLGANIAYAIEPILTTLADGTSLQGLFPESFYAGTGGPVDSVQTLTQHRIEKAVAFARKKLAKLATLIEKQADHSLTFVLQAPLPYLHQRSYDEVAGTLGNAALPLTIDVVLATSRLDSAGDGVIFAGGRGSYLADGEVLLNVYAPVAPADVTAVTSGTLRWKARVDDAGDGLAEGIYPLSAFQGDALVSVCASIGVR